jgi:predicted phosphodiesterase
MKFITINDLHLAGRAPVSRIDDYNDELFELLDQVALLAKKIEAKAVLIAGDIFHQKSRIPIAVLVRLLRWCDDLHLENIQVCAVAGNHDLIHDRIESLPTQPLGLVFATRAMENVAEYPVWLSDDGVPVGIYGLPYPAATEWSAWEGLGRAVIPNGDTVRIVLAHCFASPTGGSYFGEPVIPYVRLATEMPFQFFVFGHDHSDGGAVRIGDKWFINLGAISRGSLAQDDIDREIKCAIIDTAAGSVQQVRLQYRPASEIFDLDLKARRDRENVEIQAFVAQLKADLTTTATQALSLDERLKALALSDAVLRRSLGYLAAAEQAE